MNSQEIREKFIQFFEEKDHKFIPPVNLVPQEDSTVLFTPAGMHPLIPYFLGEEHPLGKRLVNYQKCFRSDDINEVGDNTHLTFFEMLGNWSLGDYFKEEAIKYSFEFLTSPQYLNLSSKKIFITCFKGEEGLPQDTVSYQIWLSLGIPKERIFFYGKKENFWGPVGEEGPCGPDTEMFYDTGKVYHKGKCHPNCSCGRFVEIWNDVFMEYYQEKEGNYKSLDQKNVDTGMGLERITMVIQNKESVFETDLFWPLIQQIEKLAQKPYQDFKKPMRIIADHIKAATFIAAEGIVPSNIEQGYVLRRLLRRLIRYASQLEFSSPFFDPLVDTVINIYHNIYPELKEKKESILNSFYSEEEKFQKTLKRGLRKLKQNIISQNIATFSPKMITPIAKLAFYLYESFGLPLEVTLDELKENYIPALKGQEEIIKEEFNKYFRRHQELSRRGALDKFKGGLADLSYPTVKLHTATHLLHQALREILGPHVYQKGSNITPQRLRFDFSHPQKLTSEQIKKIENLVNKKIKEALPVHYEIMSLKEAKEKGAIGVFEDKYQDKVKVYFIGDFSKEICGGPHVKNTAELGRFKIVKEEAVSQGVRRIKAVLE